MSKRLKVPLVKMVTLTVRVNKALAGKWRFRSVHFVPCILSSYIVLVVQDLTNSTTPLKSETSLVIVFSYVRSGSTFVGELFRQNSDVFFIYEPLHLGHKTKLMPDFQDVDSNKTQKEWVATTLKSFLNCEFSNISREILNNWETVISKTSEGKALRQCLKDEKVLKSHCYAKLEQKCFKKYLRATKLVRATMEEIEYFLLRNQKMSRYIKIIHLLRDPRGRLNSFINLHDKPYRLSNNYISSACRRPMKDIELRRNLEKRYPNMFMEIHYEDVAANTIDMAKRIYQFVYSEDIPEELQKWIQLNTENTSTNAKEQHFSTVRRNSSATSVAWKQQLDAETRLRIEKECKEFIHHLNGT